VTLPRFYGSGVYALYYDGHFPAYAPLIGSDTPIYLGKVDPASADAQSPQEQGDKLWQRLVKDHLRSIDAAENLDAGDFTCRSLVVKSAWQSTAELYLIDRFKPVWNKEAGVCFGIGKHGDRAATRTNIRSPWDELHPGRRLASDQPPNPRGADGIAEDIAEHFKKHSPEKGGEDF
jgi:hypothetical protein